MAVVRVDQYGLTIATAERNELVVVFVAGRLDVWSAPLLARTLEGLLAQRFQSLWVSLAGVTHIDGRGIEVLLDTRRRASNSGRELEIRSPSAEVTRALEARPDWAALSDVAPSVHGGTPARPLMRTQTVIGNGG
jgi:anti-anti-sigma factor